MNSATGPSSSPSPSPAGAPGEGGAASPRHRQPAVFIPHGGGPWPVVDLGVPPDQIESLTQFLQGLRPAVAPRALLVISAHWEEPVPSVMTSPRPPLLYDYYGFPERAYRLQWPAPGAPEVAQRVRELLGAAGIESAEDAQRGFDHGTFVPLMVAYPDAEVPTLQLSLKRGLDPAEHLAMGRALRPLRDEGVMLVGSGMSYHNLRAFFHPSARAVSERFDAWLSETMASPQRAREQQLLAWERAPGAREAHPREEHLLPLMVIAGAGGDEAARRTYAEVAFNVRLSAYQFG